MAASVDTFDVVPEGAIVTMVSRRGVQSGFDSGAVFRRQTRTAVSSNTDEAETRRWLYTWNNATPAQKNALVAVWDNAHGANLPFDFTPPNEGSPIQARFVGDSLPVVFKGAQSYRMVAVIEEVL